MIIKNATFWDGDRIARGELRNGPSDEEFDATGKLVIPAFNNAHTHLSMTLMRGEGDGLKLQDWLDKVIFPREKRLTPDLVYKGAMLGCLELIRTGTSSFTDMYYFVESVGKAVEEAGIRGLLGTPITMFGTAYYKDAEDALRLAERQLSGPRPRRVRHLRGPALHLPVLRGGAAPREGAGPQIRRHFHHPHFRDPEGMRRLSPADREMAGGIPGQHRAAGRKHGVVPRRLAHQNGSEAPRRPGMLPSFTVPPPT